MAFDYDRRQKDQATHSSEPKRTIVLDAYPASQRPPECFSVPSRLPWGTLWVDDAETPTFILKYQSFMERLAFSPQAPDSRLHCVSFRLIPLRASDGVVT